MPPVDPHHVAQSILKYTLIGLISHCRQYKMATANKLPPSTTRVTITPPVLFCRAVKFTQRSSNTHCQTHSQTHTVRKLTAERVTMSAVEDVESVQDVDAMDVDVESPARKYSSCTCFGERGRY